MHRLTPSTHACLRAGSRAGAAALLAAGAIVLGAPAATADPTAPLGSPSTGAGVSSAVFQSATCSASGGYSALVTLTNAAPEAQTFSFTTGAGGGATPAATSVGAGQSLTVRVSAPSQARAIFVTTASGGSAGSLPLSGCGDAPSTSSTLSATAEPTRTPRQSTSPAPTSDEPMLAPTISSTGASSPASPLAPTTPMAPTTPRGSSTSATSSPESSSSSSGSSSSSSSSRSSSASSTSTSSPSLAPSDAASADESDSSSTSPLLVAGGVGLALLGLALAVTVIRRDYH